MMGVSLTEFASGLNLSRPTLDSYIQMYETEKIIPKKRYDTLFHELFDDKPASREEFERRYTSLRRELFQEYLLETKSLTKDASNIIANLSQLMTEDMEREDWDKTIYSYIEILIKEYHRNTIIDSFSKMMTYLHTDVEMEKISIEEQQYIGGFYKTIQDSKDERSGQIEYYKQFIRECKELQKKRKKEEDEEKKRMESIVKQVAEELIEAGVKPTKSMLSEVVKKRI